MKRPAPAITYFFQKSAPNSKKSCPEKKDEAVASAGEGKTSLPADKKGSKTQQKTAKIVVDYLTPYYASKRITNKVVYIRYSSGLLRLFLGFVQVIGSKNQSRCFRQTSL